MRRIVLATAVLQLFLLDNLYVAQNAYIVENEPEEVECLASSDTVGIEWFRITVNGLEEVTDDVSQRVHARTINPTFSKVLVVTSGRPGVVAANGGDFGARYQCNNRRTGGIVDRTFITFIRAVAPVAVLRFPPPSTTVNESAGEYVTLECISDQMATPEPTGEWRIYYEGGDVVTRTTDQLMVPRIRNQSGIYVCSISNEAGSVPSINGSVVVQYPPEVNIASASLSMGRIVSGSDLNLSCYANARPNVTRMEIVFINESVNASVSQTEIQLLSVDTLPDNRTVSIYHRVENVQRYSHTGVFACRAFNLLGYTNSTLRVEIIDTPSAPINVTLVNHTHSEVTLDWHAPSNDGGSPVVYYQINCTATTGILHNLTQQVEVNTTIRNVTAEQALMQPNSSINATNRHTFTGLFPGEDYTCALFADNFAGLGPASESVVFSTASDVPCPPIVESEARAQNICVYWTLQCDGGEPISNCVLYRDDVVVQTFDGNSDLCQADGARKVFCDSEDLILGRQYVYTVSVANSAGARVTETAVVNADPPDATVTVTMPPEPEESSSSSLSNGAIAGIIVAIIIVVLVLIIVTIIIVKQRGSGAMAPTGLNNKPRVIADPATEPSGLKFTNMTDPTPAKNYAQVETVPAPKSSHPSVSTNYSVSSAKTEYSSLDPVKTRGYSSDPAGGHTVV
ncbi:neural cell adhesion molecule 2-like [Sycon ciliatum]|uniref:neural cell adhesion molecule 2-like n=1 Tax=Sycon ciliatum TaxID=27933 RepID=UPI0031F68A1D